MYSAPLDHKVLREYMSRRAEALGVNNWWRFEQRSRRWFNWTVYGSLVVALIIFVVFDPNARIASVVAILSGLAAAAAIVVAQKAKRPGEWNPYALSDFMYKYPGWENVFKKVRDIREHDPSAEFSVYVLEREDFTEPQGVIVRQYRSPFDLPKDHKPEERTFPVLILNVKGWTVEKLDEG